MIPTIHSKRRSLFLLRGMLLVSMGSLLLRPPVSPWSLLFLIVFAASVFAVLVTPLRVIASRRFGPALVSIDIALAGTGFLLARDTSRFLPVSGLLMVLVVSMGARAFRTVAGALAICALHTWFFVRFDSDLTSSSMLALEVLFLGAIAIYEGWLVEEVHRAGRRAEAESLQRNELLTLLKVLDAATSSLDVRNVAQSIVTHLNTVVPTLRSSLLYIDESANRCCVLASHDDPMVYRLELELEKYPELREAVRTRRPVIVKDVANDPRMQSVRDLIPKHEGQSIMAIPLTFASDVLGTLVLKTARSGDDFLESELNFCEAVARTTANVMKNAMLHEELGRRMEEVRRMQEQLMQSDRLATIGRVASGVAHELNNPLSVVLGYAELLRAKSANPADARQIDAIVDGATRCQRIVENMLSFGRARKPERRLLGLNEIVEKTLAMKKYQLHVDDIEVDLSLDGDLPKTLLDPYQIQQVLLNLINNAQHALVAARDRRRHLSLRTSQADGWIRLEVRDSGVGISEGAAKRVFEPFFSTKADGEGTGLGLSVCQGIVEEHGGRLEVESVLGVGSRFTVALPVLSAPEEVAGDTENPRVQAKGGTGDQKILVVDDERDIVDMLAEVLVDSGYQVDTAADGEAARDKAREKSFDLVITDIRMPRMGGVDLYRHLVGQSPSMRNRVVFITGNLADEETARFLAEIKVKVVGKPFSISRILEVVKDSLDAVRV